MISVLLLPLLTGATPAALASPKDDPPIRLWINNDRRFLPGDRAKVEVRTRDDGYLLVFHVDPEGHLRVLFPLDPDRDNFVRGGKKYEVRGRGDRESFEVDNSTGTGTVYAAVSRDAFRFDGFVVGDHWDYRALAPSRFPAQPEQDLNELTRRMAQGDFDYDILNYYVSDRVAYSSNSSSYYGSAYDDCYHFTCSSYWGSPFNVSVGLFFGRPYRRYYYDPYFYAYDPFYNPFFYTPYYYSPIYRPRYVYPYSRYYAGGGYYDGFYSDRYRTYRQPYTPYRFRGADGVTVGFRERYGPTRWVNTVYHGPVAPLSEPASSPVRRLTHPVPTPVERRPDVVAGPRGKVPQVEARRSPDARADDSRPGEGRGKEPRLVRREVVGESRQPAEEPRGQRAPIERRNDDRSGRPSETRRDVGEGRETRPAVREPAPAPRAEPRPERREVERSSPPPQERSGGSRPSDDGGRRRR
jgi:Domain of unknown function (DUF4384)